MKHVYAVICHRITNPLVFTVKTLLKSESSIVIIHVDNNTKELERERIILTLGEHKNLNILPQHESVEIKWGNVSQINAMLVLMKNAIKHDFNYFSLISGDDIPLSTNKDREIFFDKSYANGVEFIGCNESIGCEDRVKIDYPEFFYKKDSSTYARIKKITYKTYANMFKRKDISHLPKIYKGSNWFTITDASIHYILNFLDKNKNYLPSFEKSLCGDEIFFQTILFNNIEIRKKINGITSGMPDCEMGGRYIDWRTGPDMPRVLNEDDVENILKSKGRLIFSRKFSQDAPDYIFEKIILG